MIGYIHGQVVATDHRTITVAPQGVGYTINVPQSFLSQTLVGGTVTLFTKLVVRENEMDLYGFPYEEDRTFFSLLISVSGIGPRGALSVLDLAPVTTLANAIAQGNTDYLTKVSGVGKKTAEKIALELRDKMEPFLQGSDSEETHIDLDVLDALEALGYSREKTRALLSDIPKELLTSQERITFILRKAG